MNFDVDSDLGLERRHAYNVPAPRHDVTRERPRVADALSSYWFASITSLLCSLVTMERTR
jgi:hypothetical protein